MNKLVFPAILAVISQNPGACAAWSPDFEGRLVQAAPLTAAFQSAPPAPPASPGFSAAARAFYPETLSPAEFDGGTARGRAALAPDARAAEFLFITDEMKRVYSHLENKERLFSFSFEALKADYLAKVSAAASETDYRRLVQNFISAFSDPHLAIRFAQPSGGKNAAERIISNDVTGDGILVTRIERLYGTPQELEQLSAGLDESLTLAKTARALVVDMRGNPGGNDAYGRYFISRLVAHFIPTGKTTVKISRETIERYGSRLQEDPARPGWGTWWEGGVEPQTEESFKGPLALLIDGGCVSSCEGTAVMFKFSGAARLYGAATMGSSGYPAIIELPGGRGQVYIPTWIRIMPDGNPIEDHGVYPDVETDPAQALERALADIRAE